MKKSIFHRICSIVLSAVMCISALPYTAYADNDDSTCIEISEEKQEAEDNLIPETDDEAVEDPLADDQVIETEDDIVTNQSEDNLIDDSIEETMEIQEEESVIEPGQVGDVVASGKCGPNATYTVTDAVTGYNLSIEGSGDVEGSYSPEYIPWYRFRKSIKNIYISSGIESIGVFAFYQCESLKNITIPNSVTNIGDYAFDKCSNLISVTLSDSLTSIGERMFYDCQSLTSITIPSSVTSIGDYAFFECKSLNNITIPNSVKSIGLSAFNECESLTSITIPGSVKSIGNRAFYSCTGLKNVAINKGVTSIGNNAFMECKNMTSITIPDSVTSIGVYAFQGCSSLTSITIPKGVTTIWNYTFYKCSSLTSVTIQNGVTSIEEYAFGHCYKIKNITIPSGVTSIGKYAFVYCESLTCITIPESVISIDVDVFFKCDNLTIVGKKGSVAENYAKENGISFISEGQVEIITEPENVTAGVKGVVYFYVEAVGAKNYQWQYSTNGTKWYNSSSASAKTDTLKITVSSSNKNNIYRCMLTGSDGTVSYSGTAGIDLIPGVVIIEQPSSVIGKIGQTVTYTVVADHVESYQWLYSKDGTNWYKSSATGSNTETLTVKISSTNQNYLYKCKMTGTDDNTMNSGKAGAVLINEQPKICTASVGTTASYSVSANNIIRYQWQYSKDNGINWYNSSASGYNTDTISFKATTTNRATIYRCKLTVINGLTAYTTEAGFAGMRIVSQPENVYGSIGEKVTFTINAQNICTYQWQYSKDGKTWYKSGAIGNGTSSIQIIVSTSSVNNVYRCKLIGTEGTVLYSNVVGVHAI